MKRPMPVPPPMVYALAYVFYLYQNGVFAMTEANEPETETQTTGPTTGSDPQASRQDVRECGNPQDRPANPGDEDYISPADVEAAK